MPRGEIKNESVRESHLRALFFDDQGMGKGGSVVYSSERPMADLQHLPSRRSVAAVHAPRSTLWSLEVC